MSGHSKWSTIKRQKGVADARRGQLFTKLAREIIVAVREGGDNPEGNFRLRLVIQKARDNNMPLDNIERAIKRGSGQAEGATLVEMVLELRKVNRKQAKQIEVLEYWVGRLRGEAEAGVELSPPPVGEQIAEAGSVS